VIILGGKAGKVPRDSLSAAPMKNQSTICSLTVLLQKKFGALALSEWAPTVQFPPDIPSLLRNWTSLCPFPLKSKDQLKCCWMTLPKFILWKIWLERNARIFRNQSSTPPMFLSNPKPSWETASPSFGQTTNTSSSLPF
jgi:hypothetical protein